MDLSAEHLAAAVAAVAAEHLNALSPEHQAALANAGVTPSDLVAAATAEAAAAAAADALARSAFGKSPEMVAVLEEAYKSNTYPLKNKDMRDRLMAETGLSSGQLQDWFYRRRLKDFGGKSLHGEALELPMPMVEHIEVAAPKQPFSIDEAQLYLGRTVVKYFEPVPALNYPGGNAAGTVADAQLQALPPQEHMPEGHEHEPQFLFLVKYGDSYEEHVPWEQLAPILIPMQTPAQFDSMFSQAAQQAYNSDPAAAAVAAAAAAAAAAADASHAASASHQWAGMGMTMPASMRKAATKRHRPFRYIQLPVGMAHPLFGEGPFPVALTARMHVDNKLMQEIPQASLIRCKHPRTQWGFQYQLYGVQDFRRTFSEAPLKVVSLAKGDEGRSVDVYFISSLADDSGWRAAEREPKNKFGPSLVPSSFMQKNFGEEVQFPLLVKLVVEINGELQDQIHSCSIHHDPKTDTYKLCDDKSLHDMYRLYELSVHGWKKLDHDFIQMCCRGAVRSPEDAALMPAEMQDMPMGETSMDGGSAGEQQQLQQQQQQQQQQAMRKRGRPRRGPTPAAPLSAQQMQSQQMQAQQMQTQADAVSLLQHIQMQMPHGSQLMLGLDPNHAFATAADLTTLLSSPELLASLASAAAAASMPGHKPSSDPAQAAAEAAAAALGAMLGAAGGDMASVQNAALAMAELMDPHSAAAVSAAEASSSMAAAAAAAGGNGMAAKQGPLGETESDGEGQAGSASGYPGPHKRRATMGQADDTPSAAACRGLLALVMAGSAADAAAAGASGAGAGAGVRAPGVDASAFGYGDASTQHGFAPGSMGVEAALKVGELQHLNPAAAAAAAAPNCVPLHSQPGYETHLGLGSTAPEHEQQPLGQGAGPSSAMATDEAYAAAMSQLTSTSYGALAAAVAAAAASDPHRLGPSMAQVMQLVTPALGYPPSSEEGAALLQHLNMLMGGIMIGQQNSKDSAWGLMASATEALKILTQSSDRTVALDEEARARVVGLLNQVVSVLMATTATA